MEDKIKVNGMKNKGNSIVINLGIYDSKLPEVTSGSRVISAVINLDTGSIVTPKKIETYNIPRPEISRIMSIPVNAPIEYVEDQIKKQMVEFKQTDLDIKSKMSYFKDKIY